MKNHLELKKYRDQLEEMVLEKTNELMITRDVTIEILGFVWRNSVIRKRAAISSALCIMFGSWQKNSKTIPILKILEC